MVVEGEASWASDMICELPALKFRASVSNVDVKVEPAVTVSYRDKGPKAKAMSFIQALVPDFLYGAYRESIRRLLRADEHLVTGNRLRNRNEPHTGLCSSTSSPSDGVCEGHGAAFGVPVAGQ